MNNSTKSLVNNLDQQTADQDLRSLRATFKHSLVAFTGPARVGKDTAAKGLISLGYERRCFGDTIKKQVDPLIKQELGFSAFTENDAQKKIIRPLLELWGDINYDNILRDFFTDLPEFCVNTRLCRVPEAREWVNRGGILIWIDRPGVEPCTPWEAQMLHEMRESGLVSAYVLNDRHEDYIQNVIVGLSVSGVTRLGETI